MARRMFSTEIVNSDVFLDMPASTQCLYFHLGLHCDDDGFAYPKKIMRMINANDDDLNILLAKKFVIPFESGIVVQKHWKVNNHIRSDRYHPTTHSREKALLSLDKGLVYHLSTNCQPSGSIGREVGREVEGSFKNEDGGKTGDKELTKEEAAERMARIKNQITGAQKRIFPNS